MAAKSYAEITAAYTTHRAVIDAIVKQTNDDNAATEAEANSRVKFFTWVLWGISAFVLLLVGAGVGGIAKGVLRPIVGMTEAMQRLAGGELESEIPSLGRKDEVGAMARAVVVLKENALRDQSMEAERELAASKVAEERKAAMQQVAQGFENAVGNILKTVSSAWQERGANRVWSCFRERAILGGLSGFAGNVTKVAPVALSQDARTARKNPPETSSS